MRENEQQATSSQKADGQNALLYSAGLTDYIFLSGLVFFFLSLGVYLLFDGRLYSYLMAWVFIVIAGLPVLKIFRTIKSLSILGDSIVIGYPFRDCVHNALEIETIDWEVALVWYGGYRPVRSYTFLSIQLTNRKRINIPGSPYSSSDVRKALLDWCRTYNPTVLENIKREGINLLSE